MTILSVTGCGDDGPDELTNGPMYQPDQHGYAVTMETGQTFTDAYENLALKGDKDAVLTSVDLVDADGLEVAGFQLVTPERKINLHFMDTYPPTHRLLDQELVIPGEGATLGTSEAGYELLLGLKVTGEGYLSRKGLRINYSVDGDDYSSYFPAELTVCTSAKFHVGGRCPSADLG